MYRLMIVDDERHVVEWLYELFMESSGLDLDIFKAYSGKDALSIMETSKIDVVLSDIRMPAMNGLELLEKVGENWPGCRVVFLTGFNEFDYIYKAIKHEGVSYLLKTEDDEEIINAVRKAIESIEKELKNRELLDRALDKEGLATHLMQREMLLDIVNRKITYSDVSQDRLEKLEIPLDIKLPVILLMGRINNALESRDYIEQSKNILSLKYLSEQYLSKFTVHALIDSDKYNILWMIQPRKTVQHDNNGDNEEKLWQKAALYTKEMLETLQTACKESLELEIQFLLYDKPVLWESIGERFDTLKFAAGFNSGISSVSVISSSDQVFSNSEGKFNMNGQTQRRKLEILKKYLENGMEKEFLEMLSEISESFRSIPSKHYFPAIEIYYSLSLMFLAYINQGNLVPKLSFRIGLNKLVNIDGFDSWRDAVEYLWDLGKLIFDFKKAEQANRDDEIIERIKSFVRENIDSELSLVRISQSVNYNPSYVSRIFKKIDGTNLFDYINNVRISKAKDMLENNSENIQSIAKSVGYDSSQYFATAFKKMTGMTPHEYRSSMAKQS